MCVDANAGARAQARAAAAAKDARYASESLKFFNREVTLDQKAQSMRVVDPEHLEELTIKDYSQLNQK